MNVTGGGGVDPTSSEAERSKSQSTETSAVAQSKPAAASVPFRSSAQAGSVPMPVWLLALYASSARYAASTSSALAFRQTGTGRLQPETGPGPESGGWGGVERGEGSVSAGQRRAEPPPRPDPTQDSTPWTAA